MGYHDSFPDIPGWDSKRKDAKEIEFYVDIAAIRKFYGGDETGFGKFALKAFRQWQTYKGDTPYALNTQRHFSNTMSKQLMTQFKHAYTTIFKKQWIGKNNSSDPEVQEYFFKHFTRQFNTSEWEGDKNNYLTSQNLHITKFIFDNIPEWNKYQFGGISNAFSRDQKKILYWLVKWNSEGLIKFDPSALFDPFYEIANGQEEDGYTKIYRDLHPPSIWSKIFGEDLTLLGSKYIGPGNSLVKGTPSNLVDAIAAKHDKAYALAKSQEDIQKADNEMLDELSKLDPSGAELFHKWIAGAGISMKEYFESKFGVKYPANLPVKNVGIELETDQSMDDDSEGQENPAEKYKNPDTDDSINTDPDPAEPPIKQQKTNDNTSTPEPTTDAPMPAPQAEAAAHQKEGMHSVLQRGTYTGTLQEGDIWTTRKLLTSDYTSIRKFERVFRWNHEYNKYSSTSYKAYNSTPHGGALAEIGNNELNKDFIIANTLDPDTKWLIDDMANWYLTFYKRCRVQKISFEIVFENRKIDPGRYLSESILHTTPQNHAWNNTMIASDSTRDQTAPAWRYQWCGIENSYETSAQSTTVAYAYLSMDTMIPRLTEMDKFEDQYVKSNFAIWRDINGKLTYQGDIPWGAQRLNALPQPRHGYSGHTVKEIIDGNYVTRRQMEHFDSGVKYGNSIEFSRTIHTDGPKAWDTAAWKARVLTDNSTNLTKLIKELENEPSVVPGLVIQPEYFHFMFLPTGEYPMMMMPYEIGKRSHFKFKNFILPFETVAHITVKCDYCFFDRIGLGENLAPGTIPLPSLQMLQFELQMQKKWNDYELYANKQYGQIKDVVTVSELGKMAQPVPLVLPTEGVSAIYLEDENM